MLCIWQSGFCTSWRCLGWLQHVLIAGTHVSSCSKEPQVGAQCRRDSALPQPRNAAIVSLMMSLKPAERHKAVTLCPVTNRCQ